MLGVWVSVDKGNVKLQVLVYDIRLPPRRKVPESDARSMGFSSDKLPLTLAKRPGLSFGLSPMFPHVDQFPLPRPLPALAHAND